MPRPSTPRVSRSRNSSPSPQPTSSTRAPGCTMPATTSKSTREPLGARAASAMVKSLESRVSMGAGQSLSIDRPPTGDRLLLRFSVGRGKRALFDAIECLRTHGIGSNVVARIGNHILLPGRHEFNRRAFITEPVEIPFCRIAAESFPVRRGERAAVTPGQGFRLDDVKLAFDAAHHIIARRRAVYGFALAIDHGRDHFSRSRRADIDLTFFLVAANLAGAQRVFKFGRDVGS